MDKIGLKHIISAFAFIALFSFAAQAQSYKDHRETLEELQFQLDELESVNTYALSRSERKQLKTDKKILRKRIQRLQLAEWRRVRATNPYARSTYYNDRFYGTYYRPGFYYRRPIYRVRTIRCRP